MKFKRFKKVPIKYNSYRVIYLFMDGSRTQRMSENDKIVTRYMDDKAFESVAFAVLSKVIYESIPAAGEEGG